MKNFKKGFPGSEFSSRSIFVGWTRRYFGFFSKNISDSGFGRAGKITGKSTTGFTLVELLVVIAIIGILSSVVVASLNNARQKARDAKRISDIKQIQLALEMYYDAYSNYPNTLAHPNLTANYLTTTPKDPTGTDYFYAGLGVATCTSYHLGATLEDANNLVLTSDKDDNGTSAICNSSGPNFDGSGSGTNGDALTAPVYDIKP